VSILYTFALYPHLTSTSKYVGPEPPSYAAVHTPPALHCGTLKLKIGTPVTPALPEKPIPIFVFDAVMFSS